ncbi:MAG: hypothetical protein JXL84_24060 [Deltaproteobacteria bacterium]|nr:hypothetical protein [Deltaproteobacteria bacterium]
MGKILPLLFLMLLVFALPASAKPKVGCDVKVLAQHERLVTIAWEVKVQSERSWDACDLIISFQDREGREIHVLRETLALKQGNSAFSGHDICEAMVWKRVKKYVATLDCVF